MIDNKIYIDSVKFDTVSIILLYIEIHRNNSFTIGNPSIVGF